MDAITTSNSSNSNKTDDHDVNQDHENGFADWNNYNYDAHADPEFSVPVPETIISNSSTTTATNLGDSSLSNTRKSTEPVPPVSPGTKTFPNSHPHSLTRHGSSIDSGHGDEPVDPRVAIELESLNSATNEINKLEKELENANTRFRQLLTTTSGQLETLGKRIGLPNIDRARPFYEALAIAQNAHRACLSAATQFSRANGLHAAAKSTEVAITESKSNSKCLDSVLQEVLNHATLKVMEAEKLKKDSELSHRLRAEDFTRAESRVHELEKHLSREIEKSRPYFELKNALNINLAHVKTEIESIQNSIANAKATYSASLKRLECISEEIHQQRSLNLNRKNGARDCEAALSSSSELPSPASSSRSHARNDGCESPDARKSRYERHTSNCSSSSSTSSSFSNGSSSSTSGREHRAHGHGPLPRRSSPIGAEAETEPECARPRACAPDADVADITDKLKESMISEQGHGCELAAAETGEETRL